MFLSKRTELSRRLMEIRKNDKIVINGRDAMLVIQSAFYDDIKRWMINVDKRQRQEFLDTYWLEILFFLIGEHADQHAQQVTNYLLSLVSFLSTLVFGFTGERSCSQCERQRRQACSLVG